MERVLVMVDFGLNEDGIMFNTKADEEENYNKCNEALKDNKIVGGVVTEPTYDDNDYKYIDHTDPIYDEIQKLWCGVDCLMPSEKMELEGKFFTGSNFLTFLWEHP